MSKQAQNSMSAATDNGVLAAMTEASRQLRAWQRDHGQDLSSVEAIRSLTNARDAVGELIAAAEAYSDPGKEPQRGGDWMRLVRALARCGGAQ